ncbi:MAG: hypothetical protein ACOX3E_09010 [Desulfomonilia bacterium]|uniref:Rod shape-determining protein MreD n=1 Tax=anaerobic digester metagenome TaxID=1263854 RepID=A0A485MAA7_9ZZZZ|nr:hypothetical protein [Deltaproteobacteria bacterium]HRS54869.1 hypothetical protein [Desulfomonilia bacterium]HRV34376.1 hypothetical protein [Desulfomonilia bacterium]
MLKVWKFQISLFGILFVAILMEATVIPAVWAPLRVDFFIGMIIGQIIFVPFSQGFPFVILGSLILQAFSGARLGLIPLLYIFIFLAIEVLKNFIYLENAYTQALLGIFFYFLFVVAMAFLSDFSYLKGTTSPLAAGAVLTGCLSPMMVYIVGRLQTVYELEYE